MYSVSVLLLLLLLLPGYDAYVLHAPYNWLLNGLRLVNFLETFAVAAMPVKILYSGPVRAGHASACTCIVLYDVIYCTVLASQVERLNNNSTSYCTTIIWANALILHYFSKPFGYATLVSLHIRVPIAYCSPPSILWYTHMR